jgi:hypothetical protein
MTLASCCLYEFYLIPLRETTRSKVATTNLAPTHFCVGALPFCAMVAFYFWQAEIRLHRIVSAAPICYYMMGISLSRRKTIKSLK